MSILSYHEHGPITSDELLTCLKDKVVRRLTDMCLLAWGYNPTSPEGQNFDPFEHSGEPERIWAAATSGHANGKLHLEKNPKTNEYYVNRNEFAVWLKHSKIWSQLAPCQKFIAAWEYYRFTSKYPETVNMDKRMKALYAVLQVRVETGVASDTDVINLIYTSEKYAHLRVHFIPEKGANIGKLQSKRSASATVSDARKLLPSTKGTILC